MIMLTPREIKRLKQLTHTEASRRGAEDPIRNSSVIAELDTILGKLDKLESSEICSWEYENDLTEKKNQPSAAL